MNPLLLAVGFVVAYVLPLFAMWLLLSAGLTTSLAIVIGVGIAFAGMYLVRLP